MEKIFELAKELGEELANHSISKRYHGAKENLDKDPTSRQLIRDYEQTAIKLNQKASQGKPIEPEEKRALADMQMKIARNEYVKKWLEAQVEYLNLVRQVNDYVLKELPEEPAGEKA